MLPIVHDACSGYQTSADADVVEEGIHGMHKSESSKHIVHHEQVQETGEETSSSANPSTNDLELDNPAFEIPEESGIQ